MQFIIGLVLGHVYLKNKNITVLNISFSPIYNSNYSIEGYSIDLYRKGDMLDENIIVKLSECVKNYIGAKDEIKLMKNIKGKTAWQ